MAWRNKGAITGTNNIPLGPRKRGFGEDTFKSESPTIKKEDSLPPLPTVPAGPIKLENLEDRGRSRKRKNRWGTNNLPKKTKSSD